MHKLLARQLRRAGVSLDASGEDVRRLLDLVDEAYRAADDDRALAERSLDLTSRELLDHNERLRADLAARRRAEEALRASEERLRQSQKMEAVGLLAGGIAHDFNNIVAAMLAYADFAAEALEPEHPAFDDLKQISQAAHRAATLTRQLLAFGRRQPIQPIVIRLNTVVDG